MTARTTFLLDLLISLGLSHEQEEQRIQSAVKQILERFPPRD